MEIAGVAVLAAIYLSRCVAIWLRGRSQPSTASARAASATPDLVRALPPGSTLTVRAAGGALVQVSLAIPSEPRREQ